eukprot:3273246-Rhodomonas_salina.1
MRPETTDPGGFLSTLLHQGRPGLLAKPDQATCLAVFATSWSRRQPRVAVRSNRSGPCPAFQFQHSVARLDFFVFDNYLWMNLQSSPIFMRAGGVGKDDSKCDGGRKRFSF